MRLRRKKYSDKEVVALLQQGRSSEVLTFLYASIQPKLTAWILKNNGNIAEAQDIFQDAVISFYSYVREDRFDADKSVAAFIFSAGKNGWRNRVKQRNRFVQDIPHNATSEARSDKNEQLSEAKINSILAQLGSTCEELLRYSIFYKMSMEDIALRMNFSSADVAKSKNYKCKQRLVLLVRNKEGLQAYLSHE